MKAKFVVGDKVRTTKRGLATWKKFLPGDPIGTITKIHRGHAIGSTGPADKGGKIIYEGKRLYYVVDDWWPMPSYKLRKVKTSK